MAKKYLRHGETYCGDGTTSAAATSNGGVGAWNNINVLEGSAPAYGALAAGDTVHIRSKDAAGADIARVSSGAKTLGSSAATLAAPITWVLDAGTVWSGIAGTLTFEVSSGNYGFSHTQYNIIHADAVDSIVFKITQASYYADSYSIGAGAILSNAWFWWDSIAMTSSGPSGPVAVGYQNGIAQLINPRFSVGAQLYSHLFKANAYSSLHITTPRITLSGGSYTTPLFLQNGNPATIKVYGGSISGSTSGKVLSQQINPDGDLQFHGTIIPANMLYYASNPSGARGDQRIDGFGVDGGVGAFSVRGGGVIDSRQDGYYPTLNGSYPNSTDQAWSWKITPYNASMSNPLDVAGCLLYTGSPAAKTITQELLIADAFAVAGTAGKSRVWLEVSYIDNTTGLPKTINSANFGEAGALDTSTIGWTATTYGATLLQKRKIALTTPTAIKQDTLVTTVLRWAEKAVSATDIAFVDPEPQLS